ncbi:MAG: hypothetical protein FD144_2630 [Rhodospirillaceae bacterium]|nr:MAG: hypothetical protein FD144_2630 [Rhodospirillaceae bacterium]
MPSAAGLAVLGLWGILFGNISGWDEGKFVGADSRPSVAKASVPDVTHEVFELHHDEKIERRSSSVDLVNQRAVDIDDAGHVHGAMFSTLSQDMNRCEVMASSEGRGVGKLLYPRPIASRDTGYQSGRPAVVAHQESGDSATLPIGKYCDRRSALPSGASDGHIREVWWVRYGEDRKFDGNRGMSGATGGLRGFNAGIGGTLGLPEGQPKKNESDSAHRELDGRRNDHVKRPTRHFVLSLEVFEFTLLSLLIGSGICSLLGGVYLYRFVEQQPKHARVRNGFLAAVFLVGALVWIPIIAVLRPYVKW